MINRDAEMVLKQQLLQAAVTEWAMSLKLLAPGEKITCTLKIEGATEAEYANIVRIHDPWQMAPSDFFDWRRLRRFDKRTLRSIFILSLFFSTVLRQPFF